MLSSKLYLKSYNCLSGQHVCFSIDVRGMNIADINVVCCLHSELKGMLYFSLRLVKIKAYFSPIQVHNPHFYAGL